MKRFSLPLLTGVCAMAFFVAPAALGQAKDDADKPAAEKTSEKPPTEAEKQFPAPPAVEKISKTE
ncbi:MAG: hypothetical protein ACRD5L_14125, partial [Bryobacteraceae bacterium]